MSSSTSGHPEGLPCWIDLASHDIPAAGRFYSAVLGWNVVGMSEEFGGYTIADDGRVPLAGFGPAPDGSTGSWTPQFACNDAAATARRVLEAGGTMLLHPGQVGTMGTFAIAQDPTGATFGLWQADEFAGFGPEPEFGELVWLDLRSTTPDASREFFGAVFGWAFTGMPMASPDYTTCSLPDSEEPIAGIGGMMGLPDTESLWVAYFSVDDEKAACQAAVAAGGVVTQKDIETPFGTMATITDPAGASFWVVEAPEPAEA